MMHKNFAQHKHRCVRSKQELPRKTGAPSNNIGVMGCSWVWLSFADLSFLVNSHIVHSRAQRPACLPNGALLHRCFPSNLSTTTQGAIEKLRGTSSELCTLFLHQCGTVQLRLPWSANCSGVCWEEGMGGLGVFGSQKVGIMKSWHWRC